VIIEMELRRLKTFQTVARLSSFRRASEILNYAQSTVSVQIKLLEEELGLQLFDRLGKTVRLTEAGSLLMRYAQKMIDIEKETLARVAGWKEPQGLISIRIPQSISTNILPLVLKEFQASFPKVGFDIATCAYETLVHELKTGITDVAFLLTDSIPFAELKTELLRTEQLVIVSSPDHPLSVQSKLQAGDLVGHTIILPKHDCSYKMVFESILTEEKVEPAAFIEMNSVEAIKKCVLGSIGVAMLPVMAVNDEIAQNAIKILSWPEEKLETGLLMIWHKDKWLSPDLQAFMDTVRRIFASKPV
jgi:DNA-binding transcriptional LysR family regulator